MQVIARIGSVRSVVAEHALATLDGRCLSTEVTGGFTGRVIGMYAAAGAVHFDWFDYEGFSPSPTG
ncbi:hypothetical protein [Nonomuraea jabiensis]|uniref:beta-xylosidase family glycoside hydrolase n=1 Tax=Nonomuraea jabiensis TaxID=882448 RepID=UPI003D70E2D9